MKVLFVIDTINGSGAERSLVEISQHFEKYTPVFVHLYKGDQLKPNLEESGIKVYSLNIPGPRNFSKAAKELEKTYDKEKPDIIHSTLFRSDAVTRKLKSKYDIPLVSSFVNNSYNKLRFQNQPLSMQLKLKLVQFYDTYTSKKVDFFISNSETIKTSKAKSTNVNLDKVKVIYRGRDVDKFANVGKTEELIGLKRSLGIINQNVLLNVSRLIERKGQLDLVNAMPAILKKFPDTVLLIAGHGVFEEKLKNRTKELGIEDKIKVLGRRRDVPQLLAIADLFVYPSYFEGLPGALIEAMLSEKIIVCSDIPENMECVNDKSAIIFKRGNVEYLTQNVVKVLGNRQQFEPLGKEARKIAVKKFDIDKVAMEYEKTYDQLLGVKI
ncbi:glycosyltransferase family 4 protein [Salinimicrobium sediminilitoris]|uniref:glycosyltransferase family 4 protein n=1 Tax=Salinimicrobium sediminilitoris TaxID=2876715 RepID=UPI001E5AE4C8|nr:glycosyltransferase family 4 protein [Salinimicrobium sediminilitoris]MCC8358743.1 glycosyltransferase family 4 protein [Salinimicrobium sediminilitoris]